MDLARQLKAAGFTGLVCMRSGNTSDEDCERYRQAGCHCIVGKEVPMRRATDYIKEAYLRLDPMPHCLNPHTLPPHSTTPPSRPRESWTLQQT